MGNPKVSSSGAVGEPGGHVQRPVAQGFGLCGGQLAGQGQQLCSNSDSWAPG
jgi:hypothetical protein